MRGNHFKGQAGSVTNVDGYLGVMLDFSGEFLGLLRSLDPFRADGSFSCFQSIAVRCISAGEKLV